MLRNGLLALTLAIAGAGTCARAGGKDETPPEVRRLLLALEGEKDRVQRAIILRKLCAHPCRRVMAELASRAESDTAVQGDALQFLGTLGYKHPELVDDRVVQVIERFLDEPASAPEHVRDQAVSTYVNVRGIQAVPKLLEVLERERSPRVRYRLVCRGDTFWTQVDACPPLLARLALEDPDPRIREWSAKALADIGDARAIEALLRYLERAPVQERGRLLYRLTHTGKVSQASLVASVEPMIESHPLAVLAALGGAAGPRRDTSRPWIADLALRTVPHLPRGQHARAVGLVGRTGSLRHLAILAAWGNPERVRELCPVLASADLAEADDPRRQLWPNEIQSIRLRALPRRPDPMRQALADPQFRRELVVAFPYVWGMLREECIEEVLKTLPAEELKEATLPIGRRGLDKAYVVYDTLATVRPADAAPLLCRMYEEYAAAGGEWDHSLRYFYASLASTEQPLAAEFLYAEWRKACRSGDAARAETALGGLLFLKTPVAEDVLLRLLSVPDARTRYLAVRRLGKVGMDKAVARLLPLLLTEPHIRLGSGGCIVEHSGDVTRRSLRDIHKRIGPRVYLALPRLAGRGIVPLALVVLAVVWWRRRRQPPRGGSSVTGRQEHAP